MGLQNMNQFDELHRKFITLCAKVKRAINMKADSPFNMKGP